ncbi:MAG: hypothetical protein JRE72_07365, partial [Deltaproteobacteria bacterium]|nr:hypothetical protein [Deltaproteobacteria bacterium]
MFRYLFTTLVILAAGILIGEAPVLAGDRFVDNGDGTVTDRQQNLMWSKTDNQGDIN